MDWFLYDRDLPHERIKKWASLDSKTEANIVGENLFIVLIDIVRKFGIPLIFFAQREIALHIFPPNQSIGF